MSQFYYSKTGDDTHGPIDQDDLISLFTAGVLSKETKVCKLNDTQWHELKDVFEGLPKPQGSSASPEPTPPSALPPVPQHAYPNANTMYCSHCGALISDKAAICVKCGVPTAGGAANRAFAGSGGGGMIPTSRVSFVLLGIFLGWLGVHNFVAGYTGKGVAQLAITILIGWFIVPLLAVGIWNIVEVCTVTQDAKGVPFS